MSRRLIHKVELRLFEDNATGDYGLTHKETLDGKWGDGFNAFWNDIGIFHDVFEHYFEHEHKYFKGNYSMNIGGEMAAMGHMMYYISELGMWERRSKNGYYTEETRAIQTTETLIEECIREGYMSFGNTLESTVPNQRPVPQGEFEYEIEKSFRKIRGLKLSKEYTVEAKQYKDSVTLAKMRNLHRWGFKQAERLIPNTWKNRITLDNFVAFWRNFCFSYNAESLYNYGYKGIDFYIYKVNKEGDISWKAILLGDKYGELPDVIISEEHGVGDIMY